MTGYYSGTVDFDPGKGKSSLTAPAGGATFVSKLDAAGNFAWAVRMGGADYDYVKGLAVDAAGGVSVAGYFGQTADFGGLSLTSAGSIDIFLGKITQP